MKPYFCYTDQYKSEISKKLKQFTKCFHYDLTLSDRLFKKDRSPMPQNVANWQERVGKD